MFVCQNTEGVHGQRKVGNSCSKHTRFLGVGIGNNCSKVSFRNC